MVQNLCVYLREVCHAFSNRAVGRPCCDKQIMQVIVYERFLNAHIPFQLVIITGCTPQTRFRFPFFVDAVLKKMTFRLHILGTGVGALARCGVVLRMVDKSGKRGFRVFLGLPATWAFHWWSFRNHAWHVLCMEYFQTTLLNQPTSKLGP